MIPRSPIRVLASASPDRAAAALHRGDIGVALYERGRPELAGLGERLPRIARKLPAPPSVRAWDFLSIALAVHAADKFVIRGGSADSWTRMIALEVELAEPEPWAAQADAIADMLRFLSSDIWHVRFRSGGRPPPDFQPSLTDRDCACLFSGGLDSLIGVLDLVAGGRRPLLVSQASPKEGAVQKYLAGQIGLQDQRFEGRAIERWRRPYEPSSRARSMLFNGYGVVAATSIARPGTRAELLIPENGLISINPPLTRRHLGSLSTRTTHPHFIAGLQDVLDRAGLNVGLDNPYGLKTKGEMLREGRGRSPQLDSLAPASYSCGKGKRIHMHCGRCVPCLIRRASFHASGLRDETPYQAGDLTQHVSNDDVASMRIAVASLGSRDIRRWAGEAGPLPVDPARRAEYVDVTRRGLEEMRDFLATIRWP